MRNIFVAALTFLLLQTSGSSAATRRWEMSQADLAATYNFLDYALRNGVFRGETAYDPQLLLNLRGRPIDAARSCALTIRAWMSHAGDQWEFVYYGEGNQWALAVGPATVAGWAVYRVDPRSLEWGPGGQLGAPGSQKWGGTGQAVTALRLDPGNAPNRTVLIDFVEVSAAASGWMPGVDPESAGLASPSRFPWWRPGGRGTVVLYPQWQVVRAANCTGLGWAKLLSGGHVLTCADLRLHPRGNCPEGTILRAQPTSLALPPLRADSQCLTIEVGLYDFEHQPMRVTLPPAPIRPEPLTARVAPHNGKPTLFLSETPTFAMAFLSAAPQKRWYQEMGRVGVHLYNDPTPLGNHREGAYDFSEVDRVFYGMVTADPNAYFTPRLDLTAPGWWQAKYPEECCLYHDGTRGPQSFASRGWLADISRDLREYIRHVRGAPYGDRVIGFHLCTGYTAEWQAWGLWDGKFGDYSGPVQQAFRGWLADRYGSDEALRRAWADPAAALQTAEIPPLSQRHGLELGVLRDLPKAGTRVADFYRFYADTAASAITHLAKVTKEAAHGQCLVGFFYGYQTQHGWLELDSQHLALQRVLDCPEVDFLVSPAMYTGRAIGGTSNFMSATESVNLHGKLWLDEADIRTYKAPESDPVGRARDLPESIALLRREFGHVLSRGAGMWWFDMTGGWFSDRELLRQLRRMNEIGRASLIRDRSSSAEIAVFIDEQSLFYTVPHPALNQPLITDQIAALPRLGAPWDFYLLSDVTNPALPDYKVYLFLNAFYVEPAVRSAIDARVKKAGKTAIWLYAPGCLTDRGISLEAGQSLTGIRLAMLPQGGSLRMDLPEPALLPGLGPATTFGVPEFPGPIFYADDPDAQVLSRLKDFDKPGLVRKEVGDWTSIFCASPNLPPALLRFFAARAGVHLYSDGLDGLYANRFMLCVHSSAAGARMLRSPAPTDWYDPFADEVVARGASELSLNLAQHETRLFLFGDAGSWRAALASRSGPRE